MRGWAYDGAAVSSAFMTTTSFVQFDHMAVEVRALEASANLMASILGTGAPVPEGEDGDMLRIDLAHDAFILFSLSDSPRFAHVAFRVDVERFREVVERLRGRGIPFGNDPNDAKNGMTDDFLGGAGRVYFTDDNGHLWEVAC